MCLRVHSVVSSHIVVYSGISVPVLLPVYSVGRNNGVSPLAAGGGAIPSRIGRFECRSLPVAPALKPHYNDVEEEYRKASGYAVL